MRSFFENKRLVLLLAALALGALTVLAVSLNEIPFREAQRFGVEKTVETPVPPEAIVEQTWVEVPVWKQLLLWVLIALLVVLMGLLLSPEARKRLFLLMIRLAFTIWVISFVLQNYGDRLFEVDPQEIGSAQQGDGSFTPLPVFEPPQVSPAFSYLISFAFALFCLALIWGLYRGWKKYFAPNAKKPLGEIARIARSSLDDLSSGRNSSDVIINCYLRMNDVVSNKQQLHREIAMTPREFALRLERAGLPGEAVKHLTRLFEGVRYGDRKSAPQDVNEAVSCLETILHYCEEPV